MQRDAGTPIEHIAGVAAVIALSMVLHAGLATGSGFMPASHDVAMASSGPEHIIAAPDSSVWGQAVLRLNGIN